MTAATHYAFSYLLCSAAGFDQSVALTSSLTALLPDIDHPGSLVGRIFQPLSKFIQRKYGHRTVTHSVFAILAVAVGLSPLLIVGAFLQGISFGSWYGAVILAYSSHIFIDCFNRSGVRLMAPFSQKEYISFRTPELRVLVSSWQEYVIFFVIIFLAFTVSGEAFSIHKAARNVGRVFYKTYHAALKDYQENSQYLSVAKVEYFDYTERRMISKELPVINMYSNKAVFLEDGERFLLRQEQINEITVDRTKQTIQIHRLTGSNPALLRDIPPGAYISGTIDIQNITPDFRSTDYISIEKRVDGALLTLESAMSHELIDIIDLSNVIAQQIESLRRKLCSFQIDLLRNEEIRIRKRVDILRNKGLYDNYGEISRLTSELKRVQSRIGSLEVRQSMGDDIQIEEDIRLLERGADVWFEVFYFRV